MMDSIKNNILTNWKEELITLAVVVACLALFFLFPTQGAAQAVTAGLVFFFLVPFLYLKLVLKRNLQDYGWQLGNWKQGLLFAAISLVASLLIFYALYHYTTFIKVYQLPISARSNFWLFLAYEFILVGFFLALYEFFFRGFVLFSFFPKLGWLAAVLQLLIFALFLLVGGNLVWQNVFYLIIAVFSGLIVTKSRSLLYAFGFGLVFCLISDAVIIKLLY